MTKISNTDEGAFNRKQSEINEKARAMAADYAKQQSQDTSSAQSTVSPNTAESTRTASVPPSDDGQPRKYRPRLQESFWALAATCFLIVLLGAGAFYYAAFKPINQAYAYEQLEEITKSELIRPNSLRQSQNGNTGAINGNRDTSKTSTVNQGNGNNKPGDSSKTAGRPLSSETASYSWDFQGKRETVSLPISRQLLNDYANTRPAFTGDEGAFYEQLLSKLPGDRIIQDLVRQFREIGKSRGYNDDQVVALATSFVQSAISYDRGKSAVINRKGDAKANHPYETLYLKSGVCVDKSLLLADIYRQLGYGSAIFLLPSANHAAVGLAAPNGLDVYNSGYCYVETTNPYKIGQVPASLSGGQAEMTNISQGKANADRLGPATIIMKKPGQVFRQFSLPARFAVKR